MTHEERARRFIASLSGLSHWHPSEEAALAAEFAAVEKATEDAMLKAADAAMAGQERRVAELEAALRTYCCCAEDGLEPRTGHDCPKYPCRAGVALSGTEGSAALRALLFQMAGAMWAELAPHRVVDVRVAEAIADRILGGRDA